MLVGWRIPLAKSTADACCSVSVDARIGGHSSWSLAPAAGCSALLLSDILHLSNLVQKFLLWLHMLPCVTATSGVQVRTWCGAHELFKRTALVGLPLSASAAVVLGCCCWWLHHNLLGLAAPCLAAAVWPLDGAAFVGARVAAAADGAPGIAGKGSMPGGSAWEQLLLV